ncbi:BTB-kelch protein [Parasponia andersonii]|uniref:BTB-kelch protein n=1 Tax=Parasponia andersonii TaxID=3476 RepID=A0A2P5DAF1_PARAD|nr:BTB-kelch protein [Parasponia andersonii]
MGAGRKTHTIWLTEKSVTQAQGTSNFSSTARNLRKNELGGVIFGCKHSTMKECFSKQLFGLPAPHFSYVRNINPGLPLFLFNYSDRKLHGIFEATSAGSMNINAYGWTQDESDDPYTPYPAQVKMKTRMQCQPLVEDEFGPIITENYYESKLFCFELDPSQTEKLISLFSSSRTTASDAISTNMEKRSSLFNASSSMSHTRQGGEVGIGSNTFNVTNPDQANTKSESSLVEENQMLETIPDGWEAENEEHEGGALKQNFGLSYSEILRNVGASAANSSRSNMGIGHGTNVEEKRRSFEVRNKKESTDHRHEAPNIGWAFPSVLRNNGAAVRSDNFVFESGSRVHQGSGGQRRSLEAIDHKKSAQTFKTNVGDPRLSGDYSYSSVVRTVGTSHPQKNWNHFSKDSTAGDAGKEVKDIRLPVPRSTNLSSSDESNLESELPRFGACLGNKGKCREAVADDSDNNQDHMDLRLINEVLNSPTDKEAPTSLSQCTPDETISTCLSKNKGKECTTAASVVSFYLRILFTELSFSGFAPHLDYGSHPLEFYGNEDSQGMIDEAHRETENIREMKSSNINSVMAMVKSRLEIQVLKDRLNALECQPIKRSGNIEQQDSESTNDTDPRLEESVLLVGGFDGSSWLSAIDFYHPSLDHMEFCSSMRFVRSYASVANLNGEVYVFGGVYDNVCYDEVESYNPVSNQWTSCPSLNEKKGNLAGVSFDDKIYAIGGGNGAECFSAVEIFDVNNERWIPTRSMLHKRFAPAAAEINGTVYVVGGYDGKNYLKFAVGGYDGQKIVSTVEIFDPRYGSWMMEDSMNNCRGYSAAVVIGDTIFVIGGLNDNNEILDNVECYKEGLGWQSTDLKAIGKRCFFSAIVL